MNQSNTNTDTNNTNSTSGNHAKPHFNTRATSIGANLILRTDSYKASHWLQYPPGSEAVYSYVESRGGAFSASVFFGLQAWLREYAAHPVTTADINEAQAVYDAHGLSFNRAGWELLVSRHGGRLPIRIKAVAEGSVVPLHNVLATVENTDPDFFWLTSYLETELLRALWYPTTVATLSAAAKTVISRYLEKNSDNPVEQLPFKLHDFGARGVSSQESAALGGLAHLVNFQGTDTVSALVAGKVWYDCDMAGFSIPAAEHSTITSWGRDGESTAYRNMLTRFARPDAVLAVVSDSYNIYHACEHIWGEELKQAVIDSGATVVIRPDSGDPVTVVCKVADILAERFGTTTNSKGYKVLQHVRLIQGDGIDLHAIGNILQALDDKGYAAENIAFGMGGGLLQRVHRDTLQFAMKCSAIRINGKWSDVYKQPVDAPDKQSKKGLMALVQRGDTFETIAREPEQSVEGDLLHTVFENGELVGTQTLDNIRERANAQLHRLHIVG